MKITAHCLVKNEARFVWFSVASVIDHVDKMLLWDTGSSDGTIEIIKNLAKSYPGKIATKFTGSVSLEEFTKVRQQMLDQTHSGWLIVVDGDEVWYEDSITKVVQEIERKGNKLESIVVPTVNLVGDMYHYLEERAGNYHLANRVGHLSIRAINTTIPGLSSDKPHGTWGWMDGNGKMIQDRDQDKITYIHAPYLHTTFLQRSGKQGADFEVPKRRAKLKHEIGIPFPLDFYYPEVFFRERPAIVESPWGTMSNLFRVRAAIETPLRKIKRRIIIPKVGY